MQWCIIFWRQASTAMDSVYILAVINTMQDLYFDIFRHSDASIQLRMQFSLYDDNKQHLNISARIFRSKPLEKPSKMHQERSQQRVNGLSDEIHRIFNPLFPMVFHVETCFNAYRFQRYNNITLRGQINLNIRKCTHFHSDIQLAR